MICPKCGFEQPDTNTDCPRCGIVFSRYRPSGASPLPPPPPDGPLEPGPPPFVPAPAETLYGGPLPPPLPPPPDMPASPQQIYGTPQPPPAFAAAPYATGLASGYRFEMGAILAETFRTYFANFLPFLVLALIAHLPVFAWTLLHFGEPLTPQNSLRQVAVILLLNLICGPLTTAAVTFGVFQQMRGRDTSISECLKMGLSNFLPVLGVAIVQGMVIGLGLVFCVVPGCIFAAMYAVSVPAAVEERPGVIGAIDRSSKLTESYRWHVFGVIFVLFGLALGLGLVSGSVSRLLFGSALGVAQILQKVMNVIAAGISATAAAVMYYRLRSVKESIDVDQIASVFD